MVNRRNLTIEETNEVKKTILTKARNFDCSSCFPDNVRPAIRDLFRIYYRCAYGGCTEENCPNHEGYDSNKLCKPDETQNLIHVLPENIGDVQKHIDKEFNGMGDDNLRPCGSNLRGASQRGADLYDFCADKNNHLPKPMPNTCSGSR